MSLFTWRRNAPGPSPSTKETVTALGATGGPTSFSMHDERMPSRLPSLHFTVSIDGTWRMRGSSSPHHQIPDAVARNHLREHAARTLRRHTVHALSAAEDAVNTVIGRPLCPEPGLIVHGEARLTVSEDDQTLADKHLQRACQQDLKEEETRQRINFLRTVLADPHQCTAWWIDQYPHRVNELEQVRAAVEGITPPPDLVGNTVQDQVARFVDQLLAEMHTPQQREVFLRALTQTLRALGSTDLQQAATHWMTPRTGEPGGDLA